MLIKFWSLSDVVLSSIADSDEEDLPARNSDQNANSALVLNAVKPANHTFHGSVVSE